MKQKLEPLRKGNAGFGGMFAQQLGFAQKCMPASDGWLVHFGEIVTGFGKILQ